LQFDVLFLDKGHKPSPGAAVSRAVASVLPSADPAAWKQLPRRTILAFKLPKLQLGPKPKKWDLLALAVLVLAAVLAAINWRAARAQLPGVSLSSTFTSLVVALQLVICMISLLLLGKTAKDGTLWGNLAAVGGMLAGLSGVLLAAALWVAA
jgi:hypothetical protein